MMSVVGTTHCSKQKNGHIRKSKKHTLIGDAKQARTSSVLYITVTTRTFLGHLYGRESRPFSSQSAHFVGLLLIQILRIRVKYENSRTYLKTAQHTRRQVPEIQIHILRVWWYTHVQVIIASMGNRTVILTRKLTHWVSNYMLWRVKLVDCISGSYIQWKLYRLYTWKVLPTSSSRKGNSLICRSTVGQ
jgi:hypothetical protein